MASQLQVLTSYISEQSAEGVLRARLSVPVFTNNMLQPGHMPFQAQLEMNFTLHIDPAYLMQVSPRVLVDWGHIMAVAHNYMQPSPMGQVMALSDAHALTSLPPPPPLTLTSSSTLQTPAEVWEHTHLPMPQSHYVPVSPSVSIAATTQDGEMISNPTVGSPSPVPSPGETETAPLQQFQPASTPLNRQASRLHMAMIQNTATWEDEPLEHFVDSWAEYPANSICQWCANQAHDTRTHRAMLRIVTETNTKLARCKYQVCKNQAIGMCRFSHSDEEVAQAKALQENSRWLVSYQTACLLVSRSANNPNNVYVQGCCSEDHQYNACHNNPRAHSRRK